MTPHYKTVPDAWKAGAPNFGPYAQSPAEFGGEWWYVSPFNQKPWEALAPTNVLPPGFEAIFGPKPARNSPYFSEWNDNLKYFKQAGTPPDVDPGLLKQATAALVAWGLGAPAFYEGRYGWGARFPAQLMWDFDAPGVSWLNSYDWKIAEWQSRRILEGDIPAKIHPFVPPHILPKEKQENPT